jgi:hypothetical protein
VSFDPNRPASPEPGPAPFASPSPAPVPPASPSSAPMEGASFSPQPVMPSAPAIRPSVRRSSGLLLNVILVVAAVVAVGGIAFAIGRTTAPAAAASTRGNGAFGNGNFARGSFNPTASGAPGFGNGGPGGAFRGGFNLTGTVKSVTPDTLTITTANGQTLEFSLGSGTTYSTKTPATSADVKAGSTVEVQLQPGANGFRPNASAAPSAGPLGTASSVTVVP